MQENQSAKTSLPQPEKKERFDRDRNASQPISLKLCWQHLRPLALVLGFIFFSFFPIWQLWDNSLPPSALASPAPSARVGTIAGDFAVNGNGGANYTIPIEVPPGINGVQPNISLVYNSQQGNGLLGMGWELAGLSAIERCGKIIDTDGVKGGINFDSRDRFCFDGQRLIAVSGSYGGNGTEYHTERETWVKAISYGSQNGPQYFVINTKDGHVMEFGKTSDSRMLATGRSDNAVQIWALNKISDRNGNTVEISYQPSTGQAVTEYPTEIRYTGHAGINPLRLVKFEYEGRTDDMTGYVGGSKTETTKRLSRIKTYVDLDGDGNNIATATNLVKEYRLTYGYGTATGRSLLTQLEECDAAEICLPATQFAWQEGNNGGFEDAGYLLPEHLFANRVPGWDVKTEGVFEDFNGDGLVDFSRATSWSNGDKNYKIYLNNGHGFDLADYELPGKIFQNESGGWRVKIEGVLEDFNGDGLVDYSPATHWSNGDKKYEIYLNNGHGFYRADYPLPDKMFFNESGGWHVKTEGVLQDFNGDGLVDYSRATSFDNGSKDYQIYLNNGHGFDPAGYSLPEKIFQNESGGWHVKTEGVLQDFNGDGLVDYSPATHWSNGDKKYQIYLNNGHGFDPAGYPLPDKMFFNESGGWRVKTEGVLQDFNGDGLVDYSPATNWSNGDKKYQIYLNNGRGFERADYSLPEKIFQNESGGWRVKTEGILQDFNGDGLVDYSPATNWSNGDKKYQIYLNNGQGFDDPKYNLPNKIFFNESGGWQVKTEGVLQDFNGDGLVDFSRATRWSNGNIDLTVYHRIPPVPDLLTTITNGLGGVTQVEYKPLTDSTVYSKEITETENNNSSTSADGLGSNDVTVRSSISSSGDEDWFAFDIPSPREIKISLEIDNDADFDWFLYSGSSPTDLSEVKRGYTTSNPETGTYNATNSGRYYLKVNKYSGADGTYTLTLQSSDSIVKVQSPFYVVSRHTIKDKASNPTNTFIYDHQYEGAKIDRHRGWLGFGKTILIDRQNHTKTVSIHHTDFPLLGVVAEREVWDLQQEGRLLSKIDSSYDTSKDGNGIYKMWETGIEIEKYTEGTYKYTLKRTYQYDSNYQNPIVIADLGDIDDPDDDLYTCIAYSEGTGSDWWKSFFPSQQKIVTNAARCENSSNFNQWQSYVWYGNYKHGQDFRWERFGYDDRMNIIRRDNFQDKDSPDGTSAWITSTIAYDTYGNVTSMTDPSGNRSTIAYDAKYHTFPIRQTAPFINTALEVRTEYEPKFGIKTKAIDVNGNTSMVIADSDIDGFGRILTIQGIKPNSPDLVTLAKNELIAENNGMSVKTSYRIQWEGSNIPDTTWLWEQEYIDGLGRTYKTESKGDRGKIITNTLEFNAKGETSKESLPYYAGESQNFFTYEYNVFGELTKTTNAIGAVAEIDDNRLLDDRQITYSIADPRGDANSTQLVEFLEKNTSRGWLKEERQTDGGIAAYTYDPLGQVRIITDPLGQTTQISYNSLGHILEENTSETGTTQYTYNKNGEVIEQIDAKGQKIQLDFDALGRTIAQRVYKSDGTLVERESYTYDTTGVKNSKGTLTQKTISELDDNGNLSTIVTYSFSYNNRGEIETEKVEIDTNGGSPETYISQYTYDAVGRPDTMTYPDGAIVRYTYNDAGDLYTVELKDTGASNFTTYATYENYNALGEIGKVTYNRNQVESNYTYDAIGRITDSTTQKGAHTYFDFDYTWNKANKILAIRDNAGQGLNQNFGYDAMGRLIQANGDPYENLSYEYDRAGNITKRNTTTYNYKSDKKHQLASATYDANGNTTQSDSWTYTYDPQNRLRQVANNSVTVNKFTYDDSGSRLKKIEADGTTTYNVAPLYEVVTQPDNSQIQTKYIVGVQGAIAAISKNGSNVNLLAAIQGNGAHLEAELYDPHSWRGLAQFLAAKFTQLSFNRNLVETLVIFAFVGWLACALCLWLYRVWREASPESGWGRSRVIVARFLVEIGSLSPFSAEKLTASQAKGWLLQVWHRPASFSLALISFASMSLSGTGMLATLTPGANGAGYPVAGQELYFHYDQLGSTTLVTDVQANEVSQVNYEPYGAIANTSEGEDAFRPKFTGKEYDSNSELYYFGSRYYDAHLGRFLTPDPARQYFSPYVYGNGDPLTGIDPTGTLFFTLLAIFVGAVVGAYLGGAAVNDSYNPASWDWSSGKTWGGIIGGAILGGAAAGAGIAAGGAIAAAGLSSTATTLANMAVGGLIMGTLNASFTAMAGGSVGDVAAAFGIGFGMGALFAAPYLGPMVAAIDITQNAVLTLADPSVEGAIRLGVDILGVGISGAMRLKQGSKKYARGCSSFVAGTEVATKEGEKVIEEVAVGDTVLAYNEKTGEEGEYPVSYLLTRIAPESVIVTVGEEAIATTPEHEFYTANGWVEARDLAIGETLVRLGGKTATVTDLELHQDSMRVYNFEVDEAHTYYVSSEELLVHNPKGCGKPDVGGAHGQTKKNSERGLVESNHFPAASSYKGTAHKLGRDKMPAVTMDRAHHRMAQTTGSSKAAQQWRQKQTDFINKGQYDKAMAMDIRDMKNITLNMTGNSNALKNGMVAAVNHAQNLGLINNTQQAQLTRLAGTNRTTPYVKMH